MRLHNGLGDGNPLPCAGYTVPLAFAAIELSKNLIDFRLFNPKPYIRNMNKNKTIPFLR